MTTALLLALHYAIASTLGTFTPQGDAIIVAWVSSILILWEERDRWLLGPPPGECRFESYPRRLSR